MKKEKENSQQNTKEIHENEELVEEIKEESKVL